MTVFNIIDSDVVYPDVHLLFQQVRFWLLPILKDTI